MAGMAEIPIVIILGQRTGPSTGMATYSSQSDLNFAIYGGHGEFSRIVLTPGDIKESYLLAIKAFELAEKYQVPVILMTDKYLAESRFSGDEFDITEGKGSPTSLRYLSELRGVKKEEKVGKEGDYKRYGFTKDGISARAFPGQAVVMANSYEHDEEGYSSDDQENRIKMMKKRMGKLDDIDEGDKGYLEEKGKKGNRKIIVGWGSTKEIILDFLKDNSDFDFLHIYRPFPFPKKAIEILKEYEEIITVEGNYSGQLSDLIEKNIFKKVKRILKDDGRPFTKRELEEKLRINELRITN
jgi:2-oxoglutarate ferredoxin oxidoreductase subunit alpha